MRAILHVINTAEVGGGGEYLVCQATELRAHGYTSVTAVGRDGPAAGRLRASGVPVLTLGPLGIDAVTKIATLCRAVPHGLLHMHDSRSGFAGALASRSAGRPFVLLAIRLGCQVRTRCLHFETPTES